MYAGDPSEVVAAAARHVRPGGTVMFQEWTAGSGFCSLPHCPAWSAVGSFLVEMFHAAGTRMRMGMELIPTFNTAGLGVPTVSSVRPLGGGPDFGGYEFAAGLVRSVLPRCADFGVYTEFADVDDLAGMLRREAIDRRATVTLPTLETAWAQLPRASSTSAALVRSGLMAVVA